MTYMNFGKRQPIWLNLHSNRGTASQHISVKNITSGTCVAKVNFHNFDNVFTQLILCTRVEWVQCDQRPFDGKTNFDSIDLIEHHVPVIVIQ